MKFINKCIHKPCRIIFAYLVFQRTEIGLMSVVSLNVLYTYFYANIIQPLPLFPMCVYL
jgi:hypothetical protein